MVGQMNHGTHRSHLTSSSIWPTFERTWGPLQAWIKMSINGTLSYSDNDCRDIIARQTLLGSVLQTLSRKRNFRCGSSCSYLTKLLFTSVMMGERHSDHRLFVLITYGWALIVLNFRSSISERHTVRYHYRLDTRSHLLEADPRQWCWPWAMVVPEAVDIA